MMKRYPEKQWQHRGIKGRRYNSCNHAEEGIQPWVPVFLQCMHRKQMLALQTHVPLNDLKSIYFDLSPWKSNDTIAKFEAQ